MENYTIKETPLFPLTKKILFCLEAMAGKWTAEAKLSVQTYEQQLHILAAEENKALTSPIALTSLYGKYLKDTLEVL